MPTINNDTTLSYTDKAHCFEAYDIPPILNKLHDIQIKLKNNNLNFYNEDEIKRGVRSAVGAVGNVVANVVSFPAEVVGTVGKRTYQAVTKVASAQLPPAAKVVAVPVAGAIGATAGAVEGAVKGAKRLLDVQGQNRTNAPINTIKAFINTPKSKNIMP